MYDSSKEPCCMAHVTSGGRGEHEPNCPELKLERTHQYIEMLNDPDQQEG